jgi:hypothetical protein
MSKHYEFFLSGPPKMTVEERQLALDELEAEESFSYAAGIQAGLDRGVPASQIIEFYGGIEEVELKVGPNMAKLLRNEELTEE